MNYELVNVIQPETTNWQKQLKRAQTTSTTIISMAPDPNFYAKVRNLANPALNLIDYVTDRTYDEDSTLFFDKVDVPAGTQIFMGKAGVIQLIKDGYPIGTVSTYPNTRRLVKEITYLNLDGTKDYLEEYTTDGQLYSRIYYFRDQVQEIDFVNNNAQVVIRFHFYEGAINFITIEDPKTQVVKQKYNDLRSFFNAQLTRIVAAQDSVQISYMGIELNVLNGLPTNNVLYLNESAFDAQDNVKGNLLSIMENKLPYEVIAYVDSADYLKLKALGLPMKQVRTITE